MRREALRSLGWLAVRVGLLLAICSAVGCEKWLTVGVQQGLHPEPYTGVTAEITWSLP